RAPPDVGTALGGRGRRQHARGGDDGNRERDFCRGCARDVRWVLRRHTRVQASRAGRLVRDEHLGVPYVPMMHPGTPPPPASNPLIGRWSGPFGGVPPWHEARPSLFPEAFEVALAEQR